MTLPKIVFQYKHWSKYSYKSFTGVCFETQLHFFGLTLRSNMYRKLFIHTEGEICAIFPCKNNRHFEGLVTFPKIVFQYKYWSKYSYKSFTGVCFETQLHFCSLTLLSNICRKLFIHTEGIHINKDSSFHG